MYNALSIYSLNTLRSFAEIFGVCFKSYKISSCADAGYRCGAGTGTAIQDGFAWVCICPDEVFQQCYWFLGWVYPFRAEGGHSVKFQQVVGIIGVQLDALVFRLSVHAIHFRLVDFRVFQPFQALGIVGGCFSVKYQDFFDAAHRLNLCNGAPVLLFLCQYQL